MTFTIVNRQEETECRINKIRNWFNWYTEQPKYWQQTKRQPHQCRRHDGVIRWGESGLTAMRCGAVRCVCHSLCVLLMSTMPKGYNALEQKKQINSRCAAILRCFIGALACVWAPWLLRMRRMYAKGHCFIRCDSTHLYLLSNFILFLIRWF